MTTRKEYDPHLFALRTPMPINLESFFSFMERGGPVMWPILGLSVVSLAVVLDRVLFWLGVHRPSRLGRFSKLCDALRRGDNVKARALAEDDRSPYARVAMRLLDAGATDAVAVEAVERERPRLDRFMITLSTIITAAPLLGILGTVTGIIQAFRLLGEDTMITDPRMLSGGIAEALLTTAGGLVVALVTLFPYMAFRGQIDRAIGRMEALVASAKQGLASVERTASPSAAKREELKAVIGRTG
jgi:biopolymer transport protein ExbB